MTLRPSEGNRHHGLPRSLGGATHKSNITKLDPERHTDYHEMAGHPPPCVFLRKLLFAAVTRDHPGVPPGALEDVLPVITRQDWRTLYVPEALRIDDGVTHRESKQYLGKVSFHLACHLEEERLAVMHRIGLLGIGKFLPRSEYAFGQESDLFFRTDDPVDKMRRFLLERNDQGELLWAKPMRDDVRREVMEVLRGVHPEKMTEEGQARMLRVLAKHHRQLHDVTPAWKPSLSILIDHVGATNGNGHH